MQKLPDLHDADARTSAPLVLTHLEARFGAAPAQSVLAVALDRFEGRVALVSSFGAEAAVLLHMLSVIDRTVPVLLLDTQLLFPETLAYQQELSARFGLSDVRRIKPDESTDPDRTLHQRDSAACCHLRKTVPLERALGGFDAVLTGRKRFQTKERAGMRSFETGPDGRVRINPLANWNAEQIAAYAKAHDLPQHPLVARGFASIGCAPCTSPVREGEDPRAGRWRGEEREECGIHIRADGTIERISGARSSGERRAG
ncbi:phosphoadenylyl-sulfate reductase [Rhodalgimonas zhirmunskyi]|uniref:Adenosine 5'-phosphosulfate reductase n=1 Tax=Rhodalgimonas zhirmunskyi TaxID=2964767 RepID=A0AAJ1X4S4_9RHOB|nr:phosphoadenylyl-sulfate reductase [Rhodoalgimonas zhirmunskyi]MDQ2093409.1 phosphoadenylyl-sulfate reductase [Rhodoalgimonas zhirmunskyi]